MSLICGVYFIGSAWLRKDLLRVCADPTHGHIPYFREVVEYVSKYRQKCCGQCSLDILSLAVLTLER